MGASYVGTRGVCEVNFDTNYAGYIGTTDTVASSVGTEDVGPSGSGTGTDVHVGTKGVSGPDFDTRVVATAFVGPLGTGTDVRVCL